VARIRRFRYFAGNQPPTAVIAANSTTGPAPLTVAFNGAGSTDPDAADQGRLTYAWDFTNDGTVDSTAVAPTFTYSTSGTYTARLTVADTLGATGTATVSITAGNGVLSASIDTPVAGTTWRVGDVITFSGHATDADHVALPASALSWRVLLQHCSGTCHTHVMQTFTGVASGVFVAPDHSYPSYLELELTATDANGVTATTTRRLDPKTVNLTFRATPGGLQLVVNGTTQSGTFTLTVIQGATVSVSAPTPQTKGNKPYAFIRWSDGGAQTHDIIAPFTATTYTATYAR
jgi:PKD repeat protein